MSTTAPWRTAIIARHAHRSHSTRLTAPSLTAAKTASRPYSTQTEDSGTSGHPPVAGPSSTKHAKQRAILLHPQALEPTRIPYPYPQTRFEEGFASRLRVRGLDGASTYLVRALRAKHAEPRNPQTGQLKLLGIMPAFLSAVVRALAKGAPPERLHEDVSGKPVPARALGQGMALLQLVRASGRPREQECYAELIRALLARGHVEEATKLYVELVVDWNVLQGRAQGSFDADASEETRRAVRMIAGKDDPLGLYRDMPSEVRREDADGVRWPFPQAAMLRAICAHLAEEMQSSAYCTRALESIRVLSALLYYKQLPYGATYRSYEPLLKVMSMVPQEPAVPIWVRLRDDVKAKKGEEWMKVKTRGPDGKVKEKVPEVFRTTLYRFCRTLVKSIIPKSTASHS